MLSYSCKLLLFCKLRTPRSQSGWGVGGRRSRGGPGRCVVKTKKYKAVPYQVTPSRDFLAALISLGTVSDLSAAALQHGAAKRVVLVVVELTTYSSGRALPLVYSTQQPSGLQREQSRATVPSMSRSAEEGSTFKALPNLPIPPPVPSRRRLQRQMPTAAQSIPRRDAPAEPPLRAQAQDAVRLAVHLIAAPGAARGLAPPLPC